MRMQIVSATGLDNPDAIIDKFQLKDEINAILEREKQEKQEQVGFSFSFLFAFFGEVERESSFCEFLSKPFHHCVSFFVRFTSRFASYLSLFFCLPKQTTTTKQRSWR